ncbi:hypothetical protein FFWV33_14510 [Flavobacterium faecale]|uniref:PKD domain-containing protein n=1 Tax=Flavobacterium faecale TaxID=1355330 RepID=A0A2S1LFX5_9FLAO|nr:T9SS type B sorting domain-containing protein [Flavobacterium faecale]AWG22653.1 hypothetical protein FFWV33_14510 [Flavobacterium faecale]
MNLKLLFLILFVSTSTMVSAQDTGYNLDFETGTFLGWKGWIGECCPVKIEYSGIIKNRHTIINDIKRFDTNTCDKLSMVAPGGMYSARLGNDSAGKEVETLSYPIDVTANNSLFIYKYAVVLQDPGHNPDEQPYFRVKVYNEDKELIDPTCGSYNVVATSNLPGFQSCPENKVVFKDWTTVGLDLSPYLGQLLTVEFETGDCSLGAHFGYAYIDAYASSLSIGSAYCTDFDGVTLTAPIGFTYLWNTGETTQNLQVNNPIEGQSYSCELTSATGCKVIISTDLKLQEPKIDFETSNLCENKAVSFKNTTTNSDSTLNSYFWDFGDGTTSTDENPSHTYAGLGDFNITFNVKNVLGCVYSLSREVTINVSPEPTLEDGSICLSVSGSLAEGYILDTGLTDPDNTYKWYVDSKLIFSANESKHTAVKKGRYEVEVSNFKTLCSTTVSATVIATQMASGMKINISEDFADSSFLSVEVQGGTGPFVYKLDDLEFQDNNFYNGLTNGDHVVTVKDDVGCTLLSKDFTIFGYPKFFTPNNDGYNDFWNIPNYKNMLEAEITIFDRYGKMIRKMTPADRGWDGKLEGMPLPASDYWFLVNYKQADEDGVLFSKNAKSHFSLKR